MTEAQRQVDIPPWTLGWRLQRALSWANISVEQMAEELGVSRSTISRWCNDRGTPSRGYLKLWALHTNVPLSWLAEGDQRLPRVDSNDQPAVLRSEPVSHDEILGFRKAIRRPSVRTSA